MSDEVKGAGEFVIESRLLRGVTPGRWYSIWKSQDGADCAAYLKMNVEIDRGRPEREYRMRYVIFAPEPTARSRHETQEPS